MLQLIFLNITLLFFTYCFFSITEWFAHGFIQHGRKKNGLIAGLNIHVIREYILEANF